MKLLIQPDDRVTPIVSAIKGAKKSVEIVIFRFDRKEIEAALKAAVGRGEGFDPKRIAGDQRGEAPVPEGLRRPSKRLRRDVEHVGCARRRSERGRKAVVVPAHGLDPVGRHELRWIEARVSSPELLAAFATHGVFVFQK